MKSALTERVQKLEGEVSQIHQVTIPKIEDSFEKSFTQIMGPTLKSADQHQQSNKNVSTIYRQLAKTQAAVRRLE